MKQGVILPPGMENQVANAINMQNMIMGEHMATSRVVLQELVAKKNTDYMMERPESVKEMVALAIQIADAHIKGYYKNIQFAHKDKAPIEGDVQSATQLHPQ